MLYVASHIFILEPLLNKAMETQAINRVHRMGQLKQTKIHKYVVLNTVEETIYESSLTTTATGGGTSNNASSASGGEGLNNNINVSDSTDLRMLSEYVLVDVDDNNNNEGLRSPINSNSTTVLTPLSTNTVDSVTKMNATTNKTDSVHKKRKLNNKSDQQHLHSLTDIKSLLIFR